jgi:L-seryl-tRNA(Ser) seleniumtransferase
MNGKGRGKVTRRRALQAGAGLAAGGVLAADGVAASPSGGPGVYEVLGVKPVINATGTVTVLGGSLMPPEVVAAWAGAARHFVDLVELQDRVGERIAKLLGVEAAMVTTGAAGALLLGTAAVVTRVDRKPIGRLPDTAGMKNEVILQKAHHSCYDNQLTAVGVKLIEVETPADVGRAIGPRTALMYFLNIAEADGRIDREKWVELSHRYGVSTLIDAAADVPPVDRIARYARIGYDLIAVSGGKAIRGPNDTGLLLGRKELVAAAKLNANPHCGTIGRGMKVGKEDMVALWAAVERFVKLDENAEMREYARRVEVVASAVRDIPTVRCEGIVPPVANHVPHLIVSWDEKQLKVDREKVTRQLADGDPSIRLGRAPGTGDRGVLISVLTLQGGEERVVADRLAAILNAAVG